MSPMLSELLHAVFELGLPVAALSWLLFCRLYGRGELARNADHESIGASLKSIRKTEKESKEHSDSMMHAKWMKFGGGFYGVAAVWTLIYIEVSGFVGTVLHPSAVLDMLHKGIGELITQKITGQVTTLVDAATWFAWWPERGHSPVAWFVVAYVAYLEMARRNGQSRRECSDEVGVTTTQRARRACEHADCCLTLVFACGAD